MLLTFLGTGSAEGYPNAFCRCGNCERARTLGGRSLRKRSSALINDDLLIDFGPDIMTASFMHSRSLASVRYCLQTHSHADHLDPLPSAFAQSRVGSGWNTHVAFLCFGSNIAAHQPPFSPFVQSFHHSWQASKENP